MPISEVIPATQKVMTVDLRVQIIASPAELRIYKGSQIAWELYQALESSIPDKWGNYRITVLSQSLNTPEVIPYELLDGE